MTEQDIHALSYPHGELTKLALKLSGYMQEHGYPLQAVKVSPMNDDTVAELLTGIMKRPAPYTFYAYAKPVRNLAHAWLRHEKAFAND